MPVGSMVALMIKRWSKSLLFAALVALFLGPRPAEAVRIKDLATLQGVRDNQLVGYGLVVGLNGSGDSNSTEFTVQSLVNMMKNMGISVDPTKVKVNNVAAVMVTAALPPFAKAGSGIDVLVSSVGDAKSLVGGTLLMTPLHGPDGKIYAVAQGPLVVGGFSGGGAAASVQKNHPTAGRIPNGALVEKQVPFSLPSGGALIYQLDDSDFTTASRMEAAVNERFGAGTAHCIDGGSLRIEMPKNYDGRTVDFLAALEDLQVQPDVEARIVVNEKTGTIVMGEDVRISTVAVSHGNLSLVVSESANVSQPPPLSNGQTVAVPQTKVGMAEDKGHLLVLDMGVSIGDIAKALNAIGATPRDMISIFQAIKAAGALHADLVVL